MDPLQMSAIADGRRADMLRAAESRRRAGTAPRSRRPRPAGTSVAGSLIRRARLRLGTLGRTRSSAPACCA